eukprot:8137292-Alexandrium_andersonii.AAC.1
MPVPVNARAPAELSYVCPATTQNARRLGNPKCYSTCLGESVSGIIAAVARSCHRKHWERRILQTLGTTATAGANKDICA